MEDPHKDNEVLRRAKRLKTIIWISIFGIIIPPLVGLLGTVVGMVKAFETMGMSGVSDPEELSENISLALVTTAGGLAIAIISVAILIISIVSLRRLKAAQNPRQTA